MRRTFGFALALGMAAVIACARAVEPGTPMTGEEPSEPAAGPEEKITSGGLHDSWKGVPLDGSVQRGLDWLVGVQGEDGGWGQDGGRAVDPREGVRLEHQGNDVGNAALVALALLRAGTVPGEGRFGEALHRAVLYILSHVEEAPQEGLEVTPKKNTQLQRKLGPYIDTFLTALLLSELKDRIPAEALAKRSDSALTKCVAKIQQHQKKDGSWNYEGGWAPVIGTSVASRALYVAGGKGMAIDGPVAAKAKEYFSKSVAAPAEALDRASAGVPLYSAAGGIEELSRNQEDRERYAGELQAVTDSLNTESFTAGFGSMGGEEFMSYLNISDSLVRVGGEDWTRWNGRVKERLEKLQNQDGTWAGHHCITGRVACTAAAVMTLLTERTARAE